MKIMQKWVNRKRFNSNTFNSNRINVMRGGGWKYTCVIQIHKTHIDQNQYRACLSYWPFIPPYYLAISYIDEQWYIPRVVAGATRRVPLVNWNSLPVRRTWVRPEFFVHVVRSFVSCIVLCKSLFVLFSSGHYVVCPSSYSGYPFGIVCEVLLTNECDQFIWDSYVLLSSYVKNA